MDIKSSLVDTNISIIINITTVADFCLIMLLQIIVIVRAVTSITNIVAICANYIIIVNITSVDPGVVIVTNFLFYFIYLLSFKL